jgi:cytochrome b561
LPRWQRLASKSVQFGLYFCMVFIPITGYLTARFHELPVRVFGNFDISQAVQKNYNQETFDTLRLIHESCIKLIMVLLVLHIGAALYHRLVRKDGVLASITTAKWIWE